MASSAAIKSENQTWPPSEISVQGMIEDYSNQWHILQQLRSSVAITELAASTNGLHDQERAVVPGNSSDEKPTSANVKEDIHVEGREGLENEWFILPEATSSGHASDDGSVSAPDVGALKDQDEYSHLNSTNKSPHAITTQNSREEKKVGLYQDQYQEQWHVLEELKASVKAMSWSGHTTESSMARSHHGTCTSPKTLAQGEDFTEPHKRTPAGSLSSGSVSSIRSVSDDHRSSIGSKVDDHSLGIASGVLDASGRNSSTQYLQRDTLLQSQYPSDHQTTMYDSEMLNQRNTSSDISLESENLGFASLPNRPATIGNYGANDAASYPVGRNGTRGSRLQTGVVLTGMPPGKSGSPQDVANASSERIKMYPHLSTQAALSKVPIPARERLQPDGRDGPDVLPLQQQQLSPTTPVVSYSPSVNVPGTGLPPSAGSSGVGSSLDYSSPVGNLLVGDLQGIYSGGSDRDLTQRSGITPVIPISGGYQFGVYVGGNGYGQASLSTDLSSSHSQMETQDYMGNETQVPSESIPVPGQSLGLARYYQSSPYGGLNDYLQGAVHQDTIHGSQPGGISSQPTWCMNGPALGPLTTGSHALGVSPVTQALYEFQPEQTLTASGPEQTRVAIGEIREAVSQLSESVYGNRFTVNEGQYQLDCDRIGPSLEGRLIHLSESSAAHTAGTAGSPQASPRNQDMENRLHEITARYLGNGSEAPALPRITSVPLNTSYQPLGNSGHSSGTQAFPTVCDNRSHYSAITSLPIEVPPKDTSMKARDSKETTPVGALVNEQRTDAFSTFPVLQNSTSSYPVTLKTVDSTAVSTHSIFSRPTAGPSTPRVTSSSLISRPTAVDNIRAGLMDSEDDIESPVSKLLGPHFKATQEYLGKLKRERQVDISFRSTSSSETDLQHGNTRFNLQASYGIATIEPYSGGLTRMTTSPSPSAGDGDPVVESRQDWVAKEVDSSQELARSDAGMTEVRAGSSMSHNHERVIQSIDQSATKRLSLEQRTAVSQRDSPPSSSFFPRPQPPLGEERLRKPGSPDSIPVSSAAVAGTATSQPSLYLSNEKKEDSSYVLHTSRPLPEYKPYYNPSETSLQNAKSTSTEEMPPRASHQSGSSISTYETPLTSVRPDPFSWERMSGALPSKLKTSYSSGSSTLVSSHDEAEDTDDLLSYEAVLEGDLKYFRQLRKKQELGSTPWSTTQNTLTKDTFHTSSVNSKVGQTSDGLNRDISSINGSTDRDSRKSIAESYRHSTSELQKSDDITRKYHLSLGAGVVSPVTDNESIKQVDSTVEGQGYPSYEVPPSEGSKEHTSSGLEIEDIEEEEGGGGYSTSEIYTPTIETSSSSLYQPYIQDGYRSTISQEDDPSPAGGSQKKVTYGLYDIRNSSGPGSTNRRRRAMGLSPINGRVPKEAGGIVYVSAESTQTSMPEEATTDSGSKEDVRVETESQPSVKAASRERSHRSRTSQSRHSIDKEKYGRPRSREVSLGRGRPSDEEHDALKKRTKSASPKDKKKENSRTRSNGGNSFRETKSMLDDYVGGRRSVQNGDWSTLKSEKFSRRGGGHREKTSSGDSDQSKDLSSKRSTDLNGMWERFQESLRSSPSSTKKDSVSSHLSRLSALLFKPLGDATTSSVSETEHERDIGRKSESLSFSSSEMSSDLDQLNDGFMRNPSFSQQIKLRKLLGTVNLADVPTFPRFRHGGTTTTTSTTSDTSTSEIPGSVDRDRVPANLPRRHKRSRRVSRTPVLVPSNYSRARQLETTQPKAKCICSGQVEADRAKLSKPVQTVRKKEEAIEPRTRDVAVNVPTPKHRVLKQQKKNGPVDVGVQTHMDSEEEEERAYEFPTRRGKSLERVHSEEREVDIATPKDPTIISPAKEMFSTANEKREERRKDRYIASQNYPADRSKERYLDTHSNSRFLSGRDNSDLSFSSEPAYTPEKSRGRHSKERLVASQNSPVLKPRNEAQKAHDSSAPVWFYPVSNKHYSRPTEPADTVKPSNLRFDDQTVKTYSPPAVAVSTSMQRLTLQEAFHFAKADFVKRSRARAGRIDRSRVVHEKGESKEEGEQRVSKMNIPAKQPTVKKAPPVCKNPHAENLHHPKPRSLTKKEMKELNQKLYNNLPEVKAQKAENRRLAFYQTNRLKAQLYDQRVRDRLKKRYTA